jgi:hypothetical protein
LSSAGNNELPRSKLWGIFRHAGTDLASSLAFWIPASAGMTDSRKAAGNVPGVIHYIYSLCISFFMLAITRFPKHKNKKHKIKAGGKIYEKE